MDETAKCAQVVWRPLVITMATARMGCLVQDNVFAIKASLDQPVNCVTEVIMASTAQLVTVRNRAAAMMV